MFMRRQLVFTRNSFYADPSIPLFLNILRVMHPKTGFALLITETT
jgi:hypothetical protein